MARCPLLTSEHEEMEAKDPDTGLGQLAEPDGVVVHKGTPRA